MGRKLNDVTVSSLCSLWPCDSEKLSSEAHNPSVNFDGCEYFSIIAAYEVDLSITIEPSDSEADVTPSERIHRALSVLSVIVNEPNESYSLPEYFISYVYSPLHSLTLHLPLVNFMLQSPDTCESAISITEALLKNVAKDTLYPEYYDVIRKFPIHRSLVKVMQYASDVKLRSRAVECFRRILHAFKPEGRLLMITITLRTPGQVSGLQELVLNEYRSFVVEERKTLENETHMVFSSKRSIQSLLYSIIPLCTSINSQGDADTDSTSSTMASSTSSPASSSCDILAKRELILSTLNFIRYLYLRDSKEKDEFGVWSLIDLIRCQLIAPLSQTIERTRSSLLAEMDKLSREPAEARKERLDYMNRMSLKITNDPSGQETCGVPDDFDEKGIIASISQLDLINFVISRIQEIFQSS